MATENDPILRSLSRSGGIPGSPLEKLVRQNAYKLVNGTDADDAALDAFIATARKDEFYAESFTAPPVGATVTSKATVVPNKKELAVMGASGAVPSRATVKPQERQQTDVVQLPPDEFESIRTGKKSFVG
jgi:hypothetical protein